MSLELEARSSCAAEAEVADAMAPPPPEADVSASPWVEHAVGSRPSLSAAVPLSTPVSFANAIAATLSSGLLIEVLEGRADVSRRSRQDLHKEVLSQLQLACPVAASNLLQRSLLWVTFEAVGKMGPGYMGPVTLASSVNNVVGTAVVSGLSVGAMTLASQAHGARDVLALSIVRQQALVANLVGALPCIVLLFLMKPIARLLGLGHIFAERCGNFALAALLVTPCQAIVRANDAWLSSQKIVLPRFVVQVISLAIHVVLTYGLVSTWVTWGYIGAGVAMSLTNLLQVVMLHNYVSWGPCFRNTWKGYRWLSKAEWVFYLRYALPGVLMLAEYWVGESLTFSAGLLPDADAQLSALAIYQLTQTTCFQVPSGLRSAVTARVGNFLGAGEASQAEDAARAGLGIIIVWVFLPTALLLARTVTWARIFTTDAEVASLLMTLVYPLCLYTGLDAFLAYQNGVLNACGKQAISAKWAIRGYVLTGLPLALLLAFPCRFGVLGLTIGHCVGKGIHLAGCIHAVWQIKWQAEAHLASKRVHEVSAAAAAPVEPSDLLEVTQ